ncbi:kinase-like protein [Hyaloscypha variabilis F]|uniref:Kinase-like protein n=1 Tax=Hyaloscypha variabilis (strain UAMH 11265 / GT02V1 / F) TaxID=1149755 RepID=A0A2J6RES5_HYAVF|nr:kinase-like protein [Hyaloscypha variabilis F]
MASFDENPLMPPKMPRSVDERLGEFFADNRTGHFTDADLAQISFLLQHSNHASYSRVPRLYTVLRIINQIKALDKFIERGITDVSFPFDAKSFPSVISFEAQGEFLQCQHVVLTERLDLEKGEQGRHLCFGKEESAPYEVKGRLGCGAYAVVEKVISLLGYQEYARKICVRTRFGQKHGQRIKSFLTELRVLKRIQHIHCVKLIGSYTDPKYFALLTSPVADYDLASYMTEAVNSADKQSLLRTFFGCLCNGLQYLHQSQIRHRDVKPQNILVKGSTVLWTDFGISLDWEEMSRSTTTTDSAKSPVYCAPEVAHLEARNSSSDIWSLGCVFLEMITVLKGQTITQMRDSFVADSENYRFFANIRAVNFWIESLYSLKSDRDNEPLKWIKLMLNVNPRDRPTAQTLFSIITNQHADSDNSFNPNMFCGLCCPGDIELPPYSQSDDERWIEEPEEQLTAFPYLPLTNLDPALAQTDQCSAVLECNALQNQDLDHVSENALCNTVFSRYGNTDGEIWSPMDINHVQAAIVPHKFNHTFPGCDNNEDKDDDDSNGRGFSSRTNSVNHLQSAHKVRRRQNCDRPGCDNNKGKGYYILAQHVYSFHSSRNFNCAFPGCDNNEGKGFRGSITQRNHSQTVHSGQTWNCTFPDCNNN